MYDQFSNDEPKCECMCLQEPDCSMFSIDQPNYECMCQQGPDCSMVEAGRPRARMTAFAFFLQSYIEEQKKMQEHPNEYAALKWKIMSHEEKKPFHEMAENDKKRYDAEMQNYTPPNRDHIKDPNAPRRALSAFFWFANDERAKVKEANPEYGVDDIGKELSRMWVDAKPETKLKYEQVAEKDNARYKKEMVVYVNNNPLMQQQAPAPEREEKDEAD